MDIEEAKNGESEESGNCRMVRVSVQGRWRVGGSKVCVLVFGVLA